MSCNQLNNNRCNCKPVDLNCQATEYAPETSSPKLKCNCGPLPGKCLQNGNQIIAAPRYHFKEIKRFYQDCLIVCGALSEQAHTQAETLFDADLRGHPYHGMGRLEQYCNDLRSKRINGKESPEIILESSSFVHVDGKNSMGGVVGQFCIDLAIKKAKICGICIVVAKSSSHFGCCSYYTEKCLSDNLIGFCCTNALPFVCPTRAKEASIGTNPLSFAAPINSYESFILDMQTSMISPAQIENAHRNGELLPKGFVQNSQGEPEIDPKLALKGGKALPLGSNEAFSSQKGFGLGFMIEILCGCLSGANVGPKITRPGVKDKEPPNLGHTFIVINPDTFTPDFRTNMKDLSDHIRDLEPVDGNEEPLHIPGDRLRARKKELNQTQSMQYTKPLLEMSKLLAKELKVKPLTPLADS